MVFKMANCPVVRYIREKLLVNTSKPSPHKLNTINVVTVGFTDALHTSSALLITVWQSQDGHCSLGATHRGGQVNRPATTYCAS